MQTDIQGNVSIELACGLAEEIVRTFGEVRLRVFGTSMVPSILPGDLVSIERASLEDVTPGEVVLFLQNGRLFVHRAVGRSAAPGAEIPGDSRIITRGDRLLHEDPAVSSAELLGRLVAVERDGRRIATPPHRSKGLIVRALQSSDRVTYLYLRIAALWRSLNLRRAKCQA